MVRWSRIFALAADECCGTLSGRTILESETPPAYPHLFDTAG